jgi:lipopolysaccharide transport system ATP-binding protein
MSETIVAIDNLSKRYLVGHQAARARRNVTLRDTITREVLSFAQKTADAIRGRQIIQGDEVEEFWALRNVSFEIKRGEVIGIIGRNGAGKSTLLKILSRITEPTQGRVELHGRVASLLEIGTGFHQELTGRENIFLNGAILGMTRQEIRKKFDEIVAFAGVERFLDTPVKRYSSGMYVRLAFSVAAHLEPEILVIDEVLAVGDAEFQSKSLGKMNDVSRREGRTVVFVSHNMSAISRLCQSAIWLDAGRVRRRGTTQEVIGEYAAQGAVNLERIIDLSSLPRQAGGDNRARLQSLEWLCSTPLRHGESVKARIYFKVRIPVTNVAIGFGFSNMDGKRLLSYDTDFQKGFRPKLSQSGAYSVDVEIESLPLAPDVYYLDVGCRSGDSRSLDYVPAAARL